MKSLKMTWISFNKIFDLDFSLNSSILCRLSFRQKIFRDVEYLGQF
ncbi:hypothetical protein SAMN05421636_10534 [Pricia antarctica]|uniref:Uncharacterized protein n=1 Tax=Pricia antarctica TaxID=641691 RepID=A0A1G7CUA2_9FLAO|nr:hypothetical protein SAMN05421636_10534 [Pricia antarctica]